MKYLESFTGLCMLTELKQKSTQGVRESAGQGEYYSTIAAPDTSAYQQLEMT